jgi:hypothetical protein
MNLYFCFQLDLISYCNFITMNVGNLDINQTYGFYIVFHNDVSVGINHAMFGRGVCGCMQVCMQARIDGQGCMGVVLVWAIKPPCKHCVS